MKPFFSSDYLNETIFIAIFQKLYYTGFVY